MPARLETSAWFICNHSEWSITSLRLQRLLFLSQMIHLGRTCGRLLFEEQFYATNFGPVIPDLNRKLGVFDGKPIKDRPHSFRHARHFSNDDSRLKIITDVCQHFQSFSDTDLLRATHRPDGAWAKNYIPGVSVRIPDADIFNEYCL